MKGIPFEDIGKIFQSTIVPARKEIKVLHLNMPQGYVGFLDACGVTEGVIWKFIIDDEEIKENLGTVAKPSFFDPPHVVKKYIELVAKNDTDTDIIAQAYVNGVCYVDTRAGGQIITKEEKKKEPEEVKIETIKPQKYILFDKKIEVTDRIKMLDDKGRGLNWTNVDITNAGPDPIYFAVNEWRRPEAPLDPNMTTNLSLIHI